MNAQKELISFCPGIQTTLCSSTFIKSVTYNMADVYDRMKILRTQFTNLSEVLDKLSKS